MYKVLSKKVCFIKRFLKKMNAEQYYLEGQSLYFSRYNFIFDGKVVEMHDDSGSPNHYYFSTVTGKLLYKGILRIISDKSNFVRLLDNDGVFYFSDKNNDFIELSKKVKQYRICENNGEESLCLLNYNGEIEVFDCDSLKLLNKIKFEDKILGIATASSVTRDFSLKILKEGDFKCYYIISDSKNFENYKIILAEEIKGKMISNGSKYYIVDKFNLLDQSFRSIYCGEKNAIKLDFYNSWYVTITKKNIGKNNTYGLIDLRSNKVIYEPIYDNIIENKGKFIARIYGEDVVRR